MFQKHEKKKKRISLHIEYDSGSYISFCLTYIHFKTLFILRSRGEININRRKCDFVFKIFI